MKKLFDEDKFVEIDELSEEEIRGIGVPAWELPALINALLTNMEKRKKLEAQAEDMTPLHFAAANNHLAAIIALVEAGASLKAQAFSKMTPLHFAAANGQVEIIKVLLLAILVVNHLVLNKVELNLTTQVDSNLEHKMSVELNLIPLWDNILVHNALFCVLLRAKARAMIRERK